MVYSPEPFLEEGNLSAGAANNSNSFVQGIDVMNASINADKARILHQRDQGVDNLVFCDVLHFIPVNVHYTTWRQCSKLSLDLQDLQSNFNGRCSVKLTLGIRS